MPLLKVNRNPSFVRGHYIYIYYMHHNLAAPTRADLPREKLVTRHTPLPPKCATDAPPNGLSTDGLSAGGTAAGESFGGNSRDERSSGSVTQIYPAPPETPCWV
jgi:hypothetical protein